MMKVIDLAALDGVARTGDPRDTVGVSRRWLAQVFAELSASRAKAPTLDVPPFVRANAA